MKAPLFVVLSILFFSATLYSCSDVIKSIDYRDGTYHSRPSVRFVAQSFACLAAGCAFFKLGLKNADNAR